MGQGRWVKKSLSLGPFWRGLNTAAAENLVPLDQARNAVNVDLQDGNVRVLWGPGTSVATISANRAHMHYQRGLGTWYSEASPQFHVYDADNFSFYTTATGSQYPVYDNGVVQTKRLGVDAPANAPGYVSGGSTGQRSIRYTYVTDASGYTVMESNPSPAYVNASTGGGSITVSVAASADPAVGHIKVYTTDVYTVAETLIVIHRLWTTVSNTNQNVTINADPPSGNQVLNWDAGGDSDEDVYKYDHSPPSGANTFSTGSLHATTRYDAAPCSGIAFYGIGTLLKWSMAGYPWYWPTNAVWEAPAYIEAIVSDQGATYILTQNQVFVATGDWEEAISITPSRSPYGTTWGHSAVMSPFGMLFQAQGGVALFDGTTSRIITDGILAPQELAGKDYAGLFWDSQYIMLDYVNGGGFVIDLSRGVDNLSITRFGWAGSALTMAVAPSPFLVGPYINTKLTGVVQPWQPRQRSAAAVPGSAPLSGGTTYETGYLDAGMPGTQKKWRRMRVQATGTWTITVTAGNIGLAAPSPSSLSFTGSGQTFLPISFWSHWIRVNWQNQQPGPGIDPTAQLFSVEAEYEVPT